MKLKLHQKTDGVALIEKYIYNQNNLESDFCLAVRSASGKECHATPISKWCGYAEHLTDIKQDNQGYEQILLHELTES